MARTRRPREVVPDSELDYEEISSCHSARPATNASGASRDEQPASERKKLGGDRGDEEERTRAVNAIVRRPDRIGASRTRAI